MMKAKRSVMKCIMLLLSCFVLTAVFAFSEQTVSDVTAAEDEISTITVKKSGGGNSEAFASASSQR